MPMTTTTTSADPRLEALTAALPPGAALSAGDTGPEVRVPVAALPAAALAVHRTLDAPLLTMIGADERATAGAFSLRYVFADDAAGRCVTVTALVDPDHPVFPSVTPHLPAAQWYEREVQDLLGLRAEGHPDPRRLVLHDAFPDHYHPLRKDVGPIDLRAAKPPHPYRFHHVDGEGVMEIPVGPIHAGIIEPAHFRFSAVGEVILLLEARLFYTHRGLEKAAEGRTADGGLIVAERACGVCAAAHGVAFAQAAEAVAGIAIPPRAAAIRTLLLELERLYNHIGDIGNICAGAALMVGAAHGARIKETLQRLNERLTGHRYLRGLVAVGGLRRDLDAEAIADVRHTLIDVQRDFHEYADILGAHDSFQERLARTGILPADVARAFAAVGVAARASGIPRDSRLLFPHAAYAEHRPALAVHAEGDVRARVRVRLDEISHAFHLVREVLRTLPGGPVRAPVGPLPPRRAGLGIAESPRGDTVHWLLTDRSASYANWPVVGFAGPGNMVPDFPLINKSFELCYSCCDR
jgi:Ni,Fe-hydrogenase III large subunit/Ni,Fe-hydrogenase III component G